LCPLHKNLPAPSLTYTAPPFLLLQLFPLSTSGLAGIVTKKLAKEKLVIDGDPDGDPSPLMKGLTDMIEWTTTDKQRKDLGATVGVEISKAIIKESEDQRVKTFFQLKADTTTGTTTKKKKRDKSRDHVVPFQMLCKAINSYSSMYLKSEASLIDCETWEDEKWEPYPEGTPPVPTATAYGRDEGSDDSAAATHTEGEESNDGSATTSTIAYATEEATDMMTETFTAFKAWLWSRSKTAVTWYMPLSMTGKLCVAAAAFISLTAGYAILGYVAKLLISTTVSILNWVFYQIYLVLNGLFTHLWNFFRKCCKCESWCAERKSSAEEEKKKTNRTHKEEMQDIVDALLKLVDGLKSLNSTVKALERESMK